MSENAAPENQGPGDGLGGSIADGRVRRAALLTAALAEDCAIKMFTERADGPHPLNIDPVAAHPTPEEVEICQAAVLGAIGDKGSEKRARANRLCADGLIDLEQGLGYVLADRFGGWMPMPLEARGIGKRAADRLADKKEKERWKDKAQAARKAARKAGADEAAVAAAGQRARTKAEAAFKTAEAKISGLRAGGSELQPAPPTPEPPPAPPTPEPPPAPPPEQVDQAVLDMAMSEEAKAVIVAAYLLVARSRSSRCAPDDDEQLQLLQVRFRHALRRLQAAHPEEYFCEYCRWGEDSACAVIDWTVRLYAMGHPIPVAVAAAQRMRFDLDRAAADFSAARAASVSGGGE
jgi:pyruvate/2-oxoglutarate dehydrogenase complex dihydrolipoamide acyltransferase (E2) component